MMMYLLLLYTIERHSINNILIFIIKATNW